MSDYEVVFIAQPDLDEEGLAGLVQRYTSLIQSLGGQVTQMDPKGKRQLAYPIRKFREGYYYVTQIQLNTDAMREFERSMKLNEQIVRYLVVAKDSEE